MDLFPDQARLVGVFKRKEGDFMLMPGKGATRQMKSLGLAT